MPPTREHPFPDRAAIATAQAIERTQGDIESLEVRIRNAPVPEMDRIHQRHRNERDTLEKLATVDGDLVSAVITLHEGILGLSDAANAAGEVSRLLRESGIDATWQRREQVLSILIGADARR